MSIPEITYFLCGGTGINIGLALKKGTKTLGNKNARFIGLDSSDSNKSDEAFPIERMKDTRGSGKDRMKNFEQGIPFAEAILAKHKASSYNIVVSNTAGGTGSMLAVLMTRLLIQAGHIVALVLVSDHTSLAEKENSVGGLRSFAAQTNEDQLNAPVNYLEYVNAANKTRGEVNEEIVGGLNLLSLFFTENNGEMDYEDVKRMFNYSHNGKINPALSRIRFFDQTAVQEFEGKTPVAVASLFKSSDEVIPMFIGSLYRTTGVFGPDANPPKSMTQLHMTLDHGEALEELIKEMDQVEEDKASAAVNYAKQKDVSKGANKLGMF